MEGGSAFNATSRSGIEAISKLNVKLLHQAREQNQVELESMCRIALLSSGKRDVVEAHDRAKITKKPSERSVLEMIPSLATVSATQTKNHAIRFRTEEQAQRQTWSFSASSSIFSAGTGHSSSPNESRNYEDVLATEILRAPIVDICVIRRDDEIPNGFYRISRTPGNRKAIVNGISGGHHMYLCIKKDNHPSVPPITSLVVVFPDKNEFVPPGYFIVRQGKNPCNFNVGTNAERVFLCYKKELEGNPIVDLQMIFPRYEDIPRDFSMIETSSTGIPANINIGTTSTVYGTIKKMICYRQLLSNLSCLENDSSGAIPTSTITAAAALNRGISSRSEADLYSLGEKAARHRMLSDSASSESNSPTNRGKSDANQEGSAGGSGKMRPLSFPKRLSESIDMSGNLRRVISDERVAQMNIGATQSTSQQLQQQQQQQTTATSTSNRQFQPPSREISATTDDSNENSEGGAAVESVSESGSNLQEDSLSQDQYEIAHPDIEDAAWDAEFDNPEDSDDLTPNARRFNRLAAVISDCEGNPVSRNACRSLNAVLMAINVRHGLLFEYAIHGLVSLLRETDFYVQDLKNIPVGGLLTMMDVTVETVCSRFELCQESEFDVLLLFIKALIKYAGGKLSLLCTQKLCKMLSFVCNYFSTRPSWIVNGYSMPSLDSGAELPVFRVWKEYLSAMESHIELVPVAHSLPEIIIEENSEMWSPINRKLSGNETFCRRLLCEYIEEIIDTAEVNRVVGCCRCAVSKQSSSTNSNIFWENSTLLGEMLYADPPHRVAMLALTALCKLAWQRVRITVKGFTPRDLGSKILALDAMAEFCLSVGEKMKASKIIGYQIRRLIVPCLLHNVPIALSEPKVLAKILKLVSSLWKSWRHHVRVELSIITRILLLPILTASSQKIRPILQMLVLQEVVTWFQQPHLIVEMFVNFDMATSFVSHHHVFANVIGAIATMARRCALTTAAWEWKPAGTVTTPMTILEAISKPSVTVRDVNNFAIEEFTRIVKLIMDAAGHAHLLIIDKEFRSRSINSTTGWENTSIGGASGKSNDVVASKPSEDLESGGNISPNSHQKKPHSMYVDSPETPLDISTKEKKGWSRTFTARYEQALRIPADALLQEGIEIYRNKNSVGKCINFLIGKGYLQNEPEEIVWFLRVHKNKFDPSSIGDYLGEGGVTVDEIEHWNLIRYRYIKGMSFAEMELEPALRQFLTDGGFRLPGEAQKIDRFVEIFQKEYWNQNHDTKYCPLRHPDTLHLLTFAIIMLNTDLHRSRGTSDKKKRQRMTKEQFISNLRGADSGNNINKEFLSKIYDSIAANPIELTVEASESKDHGMKTVSSTISHAIAAVDIGHTSSRRTILTSLLADNPIDANQDIPSTEERTILKSIAKDTHESEDLLRSLANYTFPFQLTGIDTKISLDLVSFMFECIGNHCLAIVTDLLVDGVKDPVVTLAALEILCYSLTCTIFLDFKDIREEFAKVLLRFQESCIIQSRSTDETLMDVTWFDVVTENVARAAVFETIAIVHRLIVVLKDAMQEVANAERTRVVAERIEKKAHVLETNSFFVREGDFGRKTKHGKIEQLKLFLFSDEILFCNATMIGNEYKVSEQLGLSDLTLAEISDDPQGCSLYLCHQQKTFILLADCPQAKHEWVRDTQQAIYGCKKRLQEENDNEGRGGRPNLVRKLSIISRLQDQQQIQNTEYSKRVLVSPQPARDRSTTITPFFGTSPQSSVVVPGNLADRLALREPSDSGGTDSPNTPATPSPALPPPLPAAGVFTSTASVSAPGSVVQMLEGNNVPRSPLLSHKSIGSGLLASPPTSYARSQSLPLTPQEKASKAQEALALFADRLENMDEKQLNSLFTAGTSFWKSFLESRKSPIESHRIFGLLKQARFGPANCPEALATGSTTGLNHSNAVKSMSPGLVRSANHHASQIMGTGITSKSNEPTHQQQLDAWKACGEIPIDIAKKEFLLELYRLAPYWRYEQFI